MDAGMEDDVLRSYFSAWGFDWMEGGTITMAIGRPRIACRDTAAWFDYAHEIESKDSRPHDKIGVGTGCSVVRRESHSYRMASEPENQNRWSSQKNCFIVAPIWSTKVEL